MPVLSCTSSLAINVKYLKVIAVGTIPQAEQK
jgi:hypothetical protein